MEENNTTSVGEASKIPRLLITIGWVMYLPVAFFFWLMSAMSPLNPFESFYFTIFPLIFITLFTYITINTNKLWSGIITFSTVPIIFFILPVIFDFFLG